MSQEASGGAGFFQLSSQPEVICPAIGASSGLHLDCAIRLFLPAGAVLYFWARQKRGGQALPCGIFRRAEFS